MLAEGEVPLHLANERGQITVDPMSGFYIADASQGRPLPYIEVPGFVPPQVQEKAAETIAAEGIMTSMPIPDIAHGTLDNGSAPAAQAGETAGTPAAEAAPAGGENTTEQAGTAGAMPQQNAAPTAESAPATAQATEQPATAQPATQPAAPASAPKAAAMPKDDDWDLPAGMDGGAFVPIEAE